MTHRASRPSSAARAAGIALTALALVALGPGATTAQTSIEQLLRGLPQLPWGAAMGDARIAQGLKQALEIGTDNAVSLTGRLDGFLANQAIKILLPPEVRRLESGLRAVGLGPQVDELVVGMNRAAEQAAPHARTIFLDAIAGMTFEDARRILGGGDTAATDHFKSRTTDRLTTAFRPVVERALGDVGVARQWKDLSAAARMVPFLDVQTLDLDGYVVGRALDGLFFMVAEEERRIRKDPAARVTDLLREVFGGAR